MEQSGTFNEAIRLENTAFAGIGESQHGPVNQNYSVQDESDDGVLIDNHSEKDIRITLENEPGSILTDAFEIDNYEQISLEQDLDSPVDIIPYAAVVDSSWLLHIDLRLIRYS